MAQSTNYEQFVPLRLNRPLTTGELFRMLNLIHQQVRRPHIAPDELTYMEFKYVDLGHVYEMIFYKDGKIELARPSQQSDTVYYGEWHTIIDYLQKKIKEVGKAESKRPAKIIPERTVLQHEKPDRAYLFAEVINPLEKIIEKPELLMLGG